jgi:serine-type D-Ala-D-Ala carboxypeptidase/endopeptidase (penicillin-binding protein 4)
MLFFLRFRLPCKTSFKSLPKNDCEASESVPARILEMSKVATFALLPVLWVGTVNEEEARTAPIDISRSPAAAVERLESNALSNSLQRLNRRRYSAVNQGILVETLDGSKILAELNSDIPFNPASVMKMATSFFALYQLGPDYRFRTYVYGESKADLTTKSLAGDLFVISDGDPLLGLADARTLARSLVRGGLRKVQGNLVVVGPFSLNENWTAQRSAEQLRRYLARSGVLIRGKIEWVPQGGVDVESKVLLLSHVSPKLRDILWIQNAHSINEIADRLGNVLGGAEALRQFLIDVAQTPPDEISISRPSGLEYNRITARATVNMLRVLYGWLGQQQMKMQDIMPVAGIDEGTLAWRFRDVDCRGGVIGKTGTNPSKDGGVSSLAGIAYTRDHGPVIYAILNSHGRIVAYRRWQDEFLKSLIAESGGIGEYLSGHEEFTNLYAPSAWVPSEDWPLGPDPVVAKRTPTKKSKSHSRKYASRRKYGSKPAGN